MDRIQFQRKANPETDIFISYGRIAPFYNICKVANIREEFNITMEYIPDKYLLEVGTYRKYFQQLFNLYIEELVEDVFSHLWELLEPKYLKVTIHVDDKNLTYWDVTMQKTKEKN